VGLEFLASLVGLLNPLGLYHLCRPSDLLGLLPSKSRLLDLGSLVRLVGLLRLWNLGDLLSLCRPSGLLGRPGLLGQLSLASLLHPVRHPCRSRRPYLPDLDTLSGLAGLLGLTDLLRLCRPSGRECSTHRPHL
jgi:hypothetical protein